MKYETIYDLIQEARLEEDPTLPQGIWKTPPKEADWKKVEQLALDALKTQTKDLQIVAWLTEAWLQMEGIQGLNKGLNLMIDLIQTYWETLYPELTEDIDLRISPFVWMNEKFSQRLQLYGLSLSEGLKTQTPLYFYDWIKYEKKPSQAVKNKIHKQILGTPQGFYENLTQELSHSKTLLKSLEIDLLEKSPEAQGIFHKLKKNIENLDHFVTYALKIFPQEKRAFLSSLPSSSAQEVPMKNSTQMSSPSVSIQNRDHAYGLLKEIATYLESHEPHSPTPYLIRRAVAWGHMNLAELMQEVSQETGDLEQLAKLLGLATDTPPLSP